MEIGSKKQALPRILVGDFSPFNLVLRLGPRHYAELFAQEAQVLYFSHPSFILTPIIKKIVQGEGETRHEDDDTGQLSNLPNFKYRKRYTPYPPYIPLSVNYFNSGKGKIWRPKWLIWAGFTFGYPPAGYLLKKTGFDDVDVLMLEDMHAWPLLDIVKARLKIYHMRDDFSGQALWHDCSASIEREVIRSVDKVVVTAKKLEIRAQEMGAKEVHYLPNGVNFDHFANLSQLTIPEDMKLIPPPRIVYVGAISDYFDDELVGYCARELPDCSFVLIGPYAKEPPVLSSHSNIHVLGARKYDSIPAYLNYCDVGIIPFKKTKLTDSACPIKLFEYMATGLPVICTNLAEVKRMETPAFVAENKSEFVSMLKQALGLDKQTRDKLKEYAYWNTWKERFIQLKKILNMQ